MPFAGQTGEQTSVFIIRMGSHIKNRAKYFQALNTSKDLGTRQGAGRLCVGRYGYYRDQGEQYANTKLHHV